MASFTDAPWSSPESDLEPGGFCAVCLIDTNPEGKEKLKQNCKLPIRSRPGAPINKNALRNAASRIFQMKGVSAEAKRKAARTLVGHSRQAGIDVGDSVMHLAGMRGSKPK